MEQQQQPRAYSPPPPPPIYETTTTIGKKSNVFTNVRVRLLRPTPQWPDATMQVAIHGAKGYALANLASTAELRDLAKALTEAADYIDKQLPALALETARIRALIERAGQVMGQQTGGENFYDNPPQNYR